MTESRYGVRVGRPRRSSDLREVRSVRLSAEVVAEVEAFRLQKGNITFTAAIEALLWDGLESQRLPSESEVLS